MTFGQFLVGIGIVGAILVGAFDPENALLFMGLCVAAVGLGAKFVP